MNQQKYIEDLKNIKEMMSKSSKFISLSGLSGISAGIIALIGAYFAWITIYSKTGYQDFNRTLLNNKSVNRITDNWYRNTPTCFKFWTLFHQIKDKKN